MREQVQLMGVAHAVRNAWRAVRQRAGGHPRAITVEASSVCNLQCPFCVRRDHDLARYRRQPYLEPALFRALVDDVAGFTHHLNFSCYGEPLLHPDLPAMIRYAASRGIFTTLFTNATLLTADRRRELLDSGLTRMIASLESFRPGVYEEAKSGARFVETRRRLQAFAAERRARAARTPQLVLRLVVTRRNVDELEAYRELALELGADAVAPKPLTVWPQGSETYRTDMMERRGVYHPLSRYRTGAAGRLGPVARRAPCYSVDYPAVLSDGRVCLCWYDALGETAAGDLHDERFRAIWARSRGFRRGAMRTGGAFSICERCVAIGPEPGLIPLERPGRRPPPS